MIEKKTIKTIGLVSAIIVISAILLIKLDSVGGFITLVFSVLTPIVIGIVIAFVLNKPMMWIEKKVKKRFRRLNDKWVKNLSVLGVYIFFFAIIAAIIGFVVPQFIESAKVFSKSFDTYYSNFIQWYNKTVLSMDLTWLNSLISNDDLLNTIKVKISEIAQHIPTLLGGMFGFTFNVITGTVNVIIGLVISVYILADKEGILNYCYRLFKAIFPENVFAKLVKFERLAVKSFSNFITGQLTEAVILGTLCFIGMSIIGLEYALLISVLIGVTSLIPIVGAFVGTIPAMLILLLVKPIQALIFLIFILAIQQIEGNFIYPKVVGNSVGISPLLTLVAITVGGGVGGIGGMLLAVPIASIVSTLIQEFIDSKSEISHPTEVESTAE